jgi:hypothetical protein
MKIDRIALESNDLPKLHSHSFLIVFNVNRDFGCADAALQLGSPAAFQDAAAQTRRRRLRYS